MPNTQEIIKKAGNLIARRAAAGDHNYCTLTTIDPDGCPVSTTISIAKYDGIRWLTFCTGKGAPTPRRLQNNSAACFCLNGPDYHICLTGSAQVITDLETKKEMWYKGLENHFSGPEDENLAVLRFTAKRYSLFIDWTDVKGEL